MKYFLVITFLFRGELILEHDSLLEYERNEIMLTYHYTLLGYNVEMKCESE